MMPKLILNHLKPSKTIILLFIGFNMPYGGVGRKLNCALLDKNTRSAGSQPKIPYRSAEEKLARQAFAGSNCGKETKEVNSHGKNKETN